MQQADLKMQRLLARRDALPEAAAAKESSAAAGVARDTAVMRRTEAADLQREVRRLEDEIDKVRARARRDDELLQAGTVVSAKQLSDLQHEIASLQRRQSELEDAELELLERVEEATAAQTAAEQERDDLAARAEQARADADAAMSQLAAEFRQTKAERAELAAGIGEDLLALYERLRAGGAGIGAVEFAKDQCGGCQLPMIPAEAAAVRAAPVDEVVRCEECGRILVRTGLLQP